MGGGAAMRSAAAKVAGFGGVLRGSSPAAPPPQSVRSAPRSGVVPAIVSAKGGEVATGEGHQATAQMPVWEVNDWDFAGFGEEPVGEPMSRVVFGAPPSYEEAKAATAELKDAIDKVYLSSTDAAGYEDKLPADHVCGPPLLVDSVGTHPSVIGEALAAFPVPKHAVQAFKLLSQSPAAQTVVASIASDPNVWDALRNNKALQDFFQSQNSGIQFPYVEPKVEESADDALSDDWKSPRKAGEISEGGHENGLMVILQNIKLNIKLTVEEMVSNVSNFLANIFGPSSVEKTSMKDEGHSGPAFGEKAFGASFMGLALLAIIVVLIRRG